MGLVHQEQVRRDPTIADQRFQTVERGHGHPAVGYPLFEFLKAVAAVDLLDWQLRVLAGFPNPVDQHSGWADHQGVRRPLLVEMGSGGQRLDGLAQAHLIANQHPLLADDVLGPERLVAAQRCRQ